MKLVISLCDFTGVWSQPWKRYGYDVMQVDPEFNGETVEDFLLREPVKCRDVVVLAAPPCTHFTISGAQYWKAKDADGRTTEGLRVVEQCLDVVDVWNPRVWCLENPVGRLPKLLPERLGGYAHRFDPCDYPESVDDLYTKRTCLWGSFVMPPKRRAEPVRACKQGSWLQSRGGPDKLTKRLRSTTPKGFALAFAEVNALRD